jgi:hypothetical protein
MASCYYQNGYRYCNRSAWNSWQRWVVLVVVVVAFFLLFIMCSCITARRRRKAGAKPFYGTGWAARPGQYNAQPYYNNNQNYQAPPPQYSANNQPQYGQPQYGANQGYYGQQNGVELQPPQAAYRGDGGESGYMPPPGPPPGKGGDGIVR